jgi:hypothetical protein
VIVAAFAARSSGVITATQTFQRVIGGWDSRSAGLGGWNVDQHHAYDPSNGMLLLGDGRQRTGQSLANIITTVAGTGVGGQTGDGGPATEALIEATNGVTVGPDGSLYFPNDHRIRRVAPDGTITTIAGGYAPNDEEPWGFFGDGGPATMSRLNSPTDVALGPDGSIYIADTENYRIRRIGPDGIITTFAGNGDFYPQPDGVPATATGVSSYNVAVGPDGSVFINGLSGGIRRIGTDGIITAYVSDLVGVMTVTADGTLYGVGPVSEFDNNPAIKKVTPDGAVSILAGGGPYAPPKFGDGGPATSAFLFGLEHCRRRGAAYTSRTAIAGDFAMSRPTAS